MKVKSVLVIRCGALGDLICATSVIDAIKLQFGKNTIIDFVCTPGPGTLFLSDNRINKVYVLSHSKIPVWLSADKKKIIKVSKEKPYDIMINFQSGEQFKGLVKNLHAKTKVGCFSTDVHIPPGLHMVDGLKCILKDLIDEKILSKTFPTLVGSPADEIKEKYSLDEKYIVVSPSNSHQKRNRINYRAWQNDSWVELIKELRKEMQVVIVGNRGEDSFFDTLKPYPDGVIDLVAKTSLAELVGVIDGACGLITTDTGTAHMAAATNTEVFALIGPTPVNETGPYRGPENKVHIISANLPCSPCYKTDVMKSCGDNVCMKTITVTEVYNRVKSSCLL